MENETLAIPGDVEVRIRGGKEILTGRIPYNVVSHPLGERGEFREVLRPGVFGEHLATRPDVQAKWNHGQGGMGLPLGRTSSGTLKVSESPDGLVYDVVPPDSQEARDLMQSIKRGDVTGTSFGFRVKPNGERWTRSADGHLRELHKAELTEVSPTADPAYPKTDLRVSLRALQAVDPHEYYRLLGETPPGETSFRPAIGYHDEPLVTRAITVPPPSAPAPPAPEWLLSPFFGQYESQDSVREARDVEKRLRDCEKLPEGWGEKSAAELRAGFLRYAASQLSPDKLRELRAVLDTIGPGAKKN
jgi:hypothetical protein